MRAPQPDEAATAAAAQLRAVHAELLARAPESDVQPRLDPVRAGKRLANYLRVLTMEAQTIARACGKSHVRHLEPEDLVALTIEAAAMARVPLAGTDWIPGHAAERSWTIERGAGRRA